MNQLLGLLVLGSSLPLLWLALRSNHRDNGEVSFAEFGERTDDPDGTVDLHEVMLRARTVPRLMRPLIESLGQTLQRVAPSGIAAGIERSIYLCGLQGRVSVTTLLVAKFASTVAGFGIGLLCLVSFDGILQPVLAVGSVVVGFVAVNVVLNGRAARRQIEIRNSLPDVLDQMSVCVEAGLGFDAAMLRAAKTAGGPLAEELGRTIQDIRLGASRSAALTAMMDRSDVPEIRFFARALMQAEKTGVPIARVLRIQSEDARERRRQQAEEQAMKLPVKLLGPLMLCILPALFIVVLGPAIMSLIDTGLTGG